MKIIMTGRQMSVYESTKEMAEKKLAKFDKFFDENAEMTVSFSRRYEQEMVEITIRTGGLLFRAEAGAESFANAVDIAVEALERQIRKNKTRLARRLKEGAFQRTVQEEVSFAPDAEEELSIVKVKKFYFKPMTREEAVMQMNLLEHNFFAFRDEDNDGAFAVVYRRNDGGYGVIDDAE